MKSMTFPAAMAATFLALGASASSVTIDSVRQRWPWNNKVDITYTVSGGQDVAAGVFARIEFTANIAGTEYLIDGVHDVGASASDGTHTVTWKLPIGVKSDSCTMTAKLLSADNPSGDDYMVVDLTKTSGNVAWEGLLATQEASNERYNTAIYKTDKLVLRKVPAGGPYPTGDDVNYASYNSRKMWTTAKDYYIGVFPVTQYQYKKLYGSNPSNFKTGDTADYRPVEQVAWTTLRPSNIATTSPLPKVDTPNTGTFLQRLNYITGNQYSFDLPTEVMFEIATRAGATTKYYWGDTADKAYVVSQESSGGSTVAVGSRIPNAWGLYDMAGNTWELCLDDVLGNKQNAPTVNLTARTDVFTPDCASSNRRSARGGPWNDPVLTWGGFPASNRAAFLCTLASSNLGFRISMIAD